jgi:predicted DNA-binding transcriptional regulator AlpA
MDEALKAMAAMPDFAVLTRAQLVAVIGVSADTLARLEREQCGPPRVLLSKRRVGYPISGVRAWLKQKETA